MSDEEKSPSANNVVEYDAKKNDVHKVTVYQSDRAEVQRKIEVKLESGQNDVEVRNLPTCLEESSIRVDGIGNATIFDVIYHQDAPPKDDSQNEELEKLKKKKAALQKKLEIFKQQIKFIEDYAKTLSGKDTDAKQLEKFLDVYATKLTYLNECISDLEDELKVVEKSIKAKQIALNADEESLNLRGARVTIIVLADAAGDAELSLTYVVSGASWTPQYDLRAVIAPDEKSESNVNLHYRASITQYTGEDWMNVILTLSTASPLLGTTIPTLDPYWIGELNAWGSRGVRAGKPSATPAALFRTARKSRFLDQGEAIMPHAAAAYVEDSSSYQPPAFFRSRDAAVSSDGAVSKTFTIHGLSNIPSSTSENSQAHKVSIAELAFSAVRLRWITVPKSIASAFLQCKVKNTSDYVLLSGDASVFLNGNFVSKSSLPHVSPQESFSCSLGVDPAVRVTYHPQRKKIKTAGGSILTTKTATTVFEQVITIKNTRLAPLHDLRVREQIPVSSDARIKVTLLEPKQLTDAGKKTVSVNEGVDVKWAQGDEDEIDNSPAAPDVNAETAQGMLEWICDINPGASKDITLSYEVTSPSAVPWARH